MTARATHGQRASSVWTDHSATHAYVQQTLPVITARVSTIVFLNTNGKHISHFSFVWHLFVTSQGSDFWFLLFAQYFRVLSWPKKEVRTEIGPVPRMVHS